MYGKLPLKLAVNPYNSGMTTGTQLRAGNAGRVSKNPKGRSRSVPEQLEANQAEADRNGWKITGTYQDEVSASRFTTRQRKDWERLVADVEDGRIDVVILWEPSRGSRRLGEWITFLDLCREKNVLIHVTSHRHTYDLSNRRDRKALIEDGTDAEDESEKISERVRRHLAANAADGMPQGVAPTGYQRVYNDRGHVDRDQAQRVVEDKAAVVRKVICAIAAGEPVAKVSRDTGIAKSTVKQWCRNPAYAGKRRTAAGLADARWEPIVPEETWRAAVAALDAKPRAGVNSRPGGVKYLLSGIMACHECQAVVAAEPGGKQRSPYYSCRPHAAITMTPADEVIRDLVLARCARGDLYRLLTAASGEEAERARAEAEKLQAELDDWLNAGITPRAYRIKEDELLPLIAAARDRAEALTVPEPVRGLAGAGAGTDIAATWEAMSVTQRRAAVRFLLAKVELHRAHRTGPGTPARDRITWEWRQFDGSL